MRYIVSLLLTFQSLAFGTLAEGVSEVGQHRGKSGSVLIIPGINETGETWREIIPRMQASHVYFLSWGTGTREQIESRILSAVESIPGNLIIISHSASGVFLFGVMSRHPHLANRVACHIVASPLGGYGMSPAAILHVISPFFAYFGGRISFPDAAANTTIYITSLRDDPTMRIIAGYDCRYPRTKSGRATKIVNLSAGCGHTDAVAEAVRMIRL